MNEPKLPRLMKGAQVEVEYGIKRRTLASYVRRNLIGCVRAGRHMLYDRQAIDAFISSGGSGFPSGERRRPNKEDAA